MLELKSKVLRLKVNGKECDITYPKVGDVIGLNEKLEEKKDNMNLLISFLKKLGMPENIVMDLEVEHIETIIKELTSGKKS